MTRLGALGRSATVAAMLCVLASCGASSSTNVTAPTTAQCAVTLASNSLNMGASGGDGALSVSINRECSWNAKPDADWITLTSAPTGQGGATVTFHVAPNTTASTRSASIDVNDRSVGVTQAGAACPVAINRTDDAISAAGGKRTILVTAGSSCAWTATSNVAWITIRAGASGTGSGSVTLDVAPNTGLARSGTVGIAGQIYTLSQTAAGAPAPPDCTFSLSATSQSVAAAGGPLSVSVAADSGCTWSATSQATWLTITAGVSGTGDGTVGITAAANESPTARTGTATIAGQTFTVNQAAAAAASCSFSLSSTSVSAPAAAGSSSVDISTTSSCGWTAGANASWITVTSMASGTGNGTVSFAIAENTGTSPRSGTLTVAGQTVTVNQAGAPLPACAITLSVSALSVGSGKADRSVDVTASGPSCAWTASSDVAWLTITSAASGIGNGQVDVHIDANRDHSPRTGTLTISGQTVTVTQDGK